VRPAISFFISFYYSMWLPASFSVGWWLTWFRNKKDNTRFVLLRTPVLFIEIEK